VCVRVGWPCLCVRVCPAICCNHFRCLLFRALYSKQQTKSFQRQRRWVRAAVRGVTLRNTLCVTHTSTHSHTLANTHTHKEQARDTERRTRRIRNRCWLRPHQVYAMANTRFCTIKKKKLNRILGVKKKDDFSS